MFSDPNIDENVIVDSETYYFTEATNAPGIIYAEIGRKAKVYRLVNRGRYFAFKTFKPRYRSAETIENTKRIAEYKDVPGLAVASRLAITPAKYPELIKQNNAFAYSILMPWVEGKSWFNYVTGKVPLTHPQSLRLAYTLASAISELETRDLAHCDLSSSNFIFFPDFSRVELVDIEDMFGYGLLPPKEKPKGTGGYAPRWIQENGVWEAAGDRFAAGILLAEILGWQFEEVREASAGDAYFAEGEFGNKSKRFRLLSERLEQVHPELANLFKTVWYAESLEECPRISDWMKVLSRIIEPIPAQIETAPPNWVASAGDQLTSMLSQNVPAQSPKVGGTLEGRIGGKTIALIVAGIAVVLIVFVLGLVGGVVAISLTGSGTQDKNQSANTPAAASVESGPQSYPSTVTATLSLLHPATSIPSNIPSQPPAPSSDEPSGKIVFTCQIDRNAKSDQICMINANGTNWKQLTDNGFENFYASPSPDGNSIVYVSNRSGHFEIYELKLNGGETQLTFGIGDLYAPEISPDGHYIVFTNDYNQYSHIWIMNRNGGNPHEVYTAPGDDALDPSWSPDSRQILFAAGSANDKQLYIVGVDGTGARSVNPSFSTRGRSDWSPLGDWIAGYTGASWHREIYLMRSDGSDLHQISNGGNVQAPSFSPDGQWIAFTGYIDYPGDSDGCEIYIMRINGTDIRRLTDNSYCDWQPRWGP